MNLTAELSQLIDQLEPIARPGGHGRALMVMGSRPGAGASTVARELARLAALRSQRGVWLYDLDFSGNAQSRAARVHGPVFDAALGREPFWALQTVTGRARIVARQSVVPNLFVTEMQSDPGAVERVGLRAAPDYWAAIRESIDLAIIDAPSQSTAPLNLAADLDEARGGVVAGLILNRTERIQSAA